MTTDEDGAREAPSSALLTDLRRALDESRAAADALRRSEAYLAQAQALSRTGSFGWVPATDTVYWSKETYCIHGFDPGMAPTLQRALDRIHPDDLAAVQEVIAAARAGAPRIDIEYRLQIPGGALRHVHVLAEAGADEGGPVTFIGAIMDVTERKRLIDSALAAERFARGQAEALTSALDVLAREPDPERVIEHGLRTLIDRLQAKSCSVWLKQEDGLMSFAYALEHAGFKTRADAELAAVSPSLPVDAIWPWPEVFRSRESVLLDDIREAPAFPWRAHVLAQGVVSILVVPMLMADEVAGVLGVRFTRKPACSREEIALAQALASHCMLAIQLSRLMARARLSSAVMERNRIARDLHDTIAQGLTGVIVQLEAAADASARDMRTEADAHAARARELARESLQEARRSVHALRPHSLEDRDLCDALLHMAEQMTAGTKIRLAFAVVGEPPAMPPEWEQNVLRIAQEAMANALRHADPGRIEIRLSFTSDTFAMHIEDDGRGFAPGRTRDGRGLLGMTERAAEMGGEARIDSVVGQGTAISVLLPLDARFRMVWAC